MELSYIKELWSKNVNTDRTQENNTWDSYVRDCVNDDSVNFENNSFLKFIQSKVELTSDMRTLDIGCGEGKYSLAIASKVKNVLGVDSSSEMIKKAKSLSEQNGVNNVEFVEKDWCNCDENEFTGQYDLVFAHNTHAIADFDTFMKMMNASRKYCFLCILARRSDEVMDSLRLILRRGKVKNNDSVAYIFDTIWLNGCNPEVAYEQVECKSKRTLEEAIPWYLEKLKEEKALSDEEEEKVVRFLSNVSVSGYVYETIRTTLVNFFWKFN